MSDYGTFSTAAQAAGASIAARVFSGEPVTTDLVDDEAAREAARSIFGTAEQQPARVERDPSKPFVPGSPAPVEGESPPPRGPSVPREGSQVRLPQPNDMQTLIANLFSGRN